MSSFPTNADADRLGRVILRERLGLKPKERVTIESYPSSLPWAAGFVREARRAGAYPMVHYEDEEAYWAGAEHGQAKLIGTMAEHEKAALEETDVYIFFWGPEDSARRDALSTKAQDSLFAFNPNWYKLAEKAGLRGARMAVARANPANAGRFGVSLESWRSELLEASTRNPKTLEALAKKVEKPLSGKGEVHLTHANGTDLTLALADRPVQKAMGILPPKKERGRFGMMANVPDGSLYVSVDESTADGTLVANRRTSAGGLVLEGGRWTFEDGHLTSHHFSTGDTAFSKLFAAGTGAKDRPSFIEIGVNPELHESPFLEENELGAVSVGVGNNAGFGGKNKSSIFQILTLGGADLTINGRSVVSGGRLV